MSIQDQLDDIHHKMAMTVKAALGENAVVITVISIHDKPAGQMVLSDTERHDKATVANRLRVAADCLAPIQYVTDTATA